MNSRRLALKGVAILFALGQSGCASKNDDASVFECLFAELGTPGRTYVIREDVEEFSDYVPASDRTQFKAFAFKRPEPKHDPNDFGSVSVNLLSSESYIQIFDASCAKGWVTFHKRFPSAKVLIGLSHVAFHANGKEAVVLMYVGKACLGGRWDFMYFALHGSAWKFSKSVNAGIA